MYEHNEPPIVPGAARTPRRFGGGAVLAVALASAGLAAAATFLLVRTPSPSAALHDEAEAVVYTCPMHPQIVRDHPGTCPICGMNLVRVDKAKRKPEGAGPSQPSADKKPLFYRSPMDPKQTSHTPRKDEMGMDYVPVYADDLGAASEVKGLATVEIDPARQQLIGLKTAEVSEGPISGAWRTAGRVAIDETRVRHVNLKVPGFVERIYVDFIGKSVQRGDPLFSIYSPELLAAQEEYLLALKTKQSLDKGHAAFAGDGDALVDAARRKLALWDVPEAAIQRLAQSGQPQKALTFVSPVSGVVTKKDVVEGMKLDAGAMPYEIVDLSSVWVLVDVYESELRFVKTNMAASLRLNAYPNREFKGKVVFIDPLLDPRTRTLKLRLTFPNPTRELRPEMFGEVVLLGAPHVGLRIPEDAVIDSGTEKLVFVALGQGKFQPRSLKLGANDGSFVEVLSGLARGESVVTRANFLIDSESRLRAALAEMGSAQGQLDAPESARVLPGSSEAQDADGARAPSAAHKRASRPAAGPTSAPTPSSPVPSTPLTPAAPAGEAHVHHHPSP